MLSFLRSIYGKNEFPLHEIVKKEKEIHANFTIAPTTAKLQPGDIVIS